MPDCKSDHCKLEHLIKTLVPIGEPLWGHAVNSVRQAAELVDSANAMSATEADHFKRFRDVDRIKAEVRTWLAWQPNPGLGFGAALNGRILSHDSPQAIGFLRWLRNLYGFAELASI